MQSFGHQWVTYLTQSYKASDSHIWHKLLIKAIDKNLEFLMGNRVGLSFYDAKTANSAYKCSGICDKIR